MAPSPWDCELGTRKDGAFSPVITRVTVSVVATARAIAASSSSGRRDPISTDTAGSRSSLTLSLPKRCTTTPTGLVGFPTRNTGGVRTRGLRPRQPPRTVSFWGTNGTERTGDGCHRRRPSCAGVTDTPRQSWPGGVTRMTVARGGRTSLSATVTPAYTTTPASTAYIHGWRNRWSSVNHGSESIAWGPVSSVSPL